MGRMKIILKNDNEPAIKALSSRVKHMRMRVQPTVLEESPEHQPQASRVAERCVQSTNVMNMTAKTAVRHRVGCKAPSDQVVLTWFVRHSASVHNRYQVRGDGRTP